MSKSLNSILLLAKQQTAVGVDAGPIGTNAIQARNIQITPLEAETINTGLIQPHFGASADVVTSKRLSVSFEVLFASSGVLGTAPAWGVLMKMAGWSETIVAATNVDYSPATPTAASPILPGTIYINLDGILHKAIDVYLDANLTLDPRGFPVMQFTARGAWQPATDAAALVPNYSLFQQPLAVGSPHTTFTYFGETPCVESFSINTNTQISITERINCNATSLTGRSIEGSLGIEMVSVADYDWLTAQSNASAGALSMIHGTVPGQTIELTGPKVQALPGGAYGDSDRQAILNFSLKFLPNAGNDELRIRVR